MFSLCYFSAVNKQRMMTIFDGHTVFMILNTTELGGHIMGQLLC